MQTTQWQNGKSGKARLTLCRKVGRMPCTFDEVEYQIWNSGTGEIREYDFFN